jgi:hypothetical protein
VRPRGRSAAPASRAARIACLALRAEAVQRTDPLRARRFAQRRRRVDAELVEQAPRPLGPQAGQCRDRHQAGRIALAELHGSRDLAGLDQVEDLLLERRADAG